MSKSIRDFEYAEIPETAAASFADSLPSRFFEPIPEFRRGPLRSDDDHSGQLMRARQASLRIIARFCDLTGGSKRRKKWLAIRAENQRRHDFAASLGHWPMSRTS